MIVGITPGWQQMQIAFESARAALAQDASSGEVLKAAKEHAAFAGIMRTNLCRMLDELGLPERVGVTETAALFSTHASQLHSTSAVRYPVLVGEQRKNYTGRSPDLARSDFLLGFVRAYLLPELRELGDPIIVPLGDAVAAALRAEDVGERRCLYGFPHPSGGNGYRVVRFAEARQRLRAQVSSL